MKRRDLLAGFAAGVVAVPGCLADSDGASSATPTETPTATETTVTDGTPVATETATGTASGELVREAFAVPELAAPNSPDSFGVYGDGDEQYVVALLAGDAGTAPAVGDVELIADGETYSATIDVGRYRWGLFDYGAAYAAADSPEGWVVFRLPNPHAAENATITWPGGEYLLGDGALADLARPPASFEIKSFDAPDSIAAGESFTLSLTVENTGDVDGTFVGAVNRNFPAYAPVASIRLPVAAGETATWGREVTVRDMGYEGSAELRLWLYWRDDSADREVTVTVGTDSPEETDSDTDTPTATETQPITPDADE